MNWALFVQLLVTALVAFLSTFLAHRLSARRDRINSKRDQRVAFLIDAYRRIEFISNRPEIDDAKPIESAFADIQLFGSVRQIKLTHDAMARFASEKSASLDSMLTELRNDLRQELGLEQVSDKLLFLRFPCSRTSQKELKAVVSGGTRKG